MKTIRGCYLPWMAALAVSTQVVSTSAAMAVATPALSAATSPTLPVVTPSKLAQQNIKNTAMHAHTLAFLRAFLPWCGQTFTGRVVVDNAKDPRFDGQELRLHIADCSSLSSYLQLTPSPSSMQKLSTTTLLRMPFHVGTDQSRTWLFSLTEQGLHFQHQHLHPDGQPDAVSLYGGYLTHVEATSSHQVRYDFPADEFSKSMFTKHNMTVSNANTWQIVLQYDAQQQLSAMQYQLIRPGRQFTVRFEFSSPQAL
jgi:hypothetical protein